MREAGSQEEGSDSFIQSSKTEHLWGGEVHLFPLASLLVHKQKARL